MALQCERNSFFGSIFKPFLSKYHIRWPMVPFMYDDVKNVVKSILQFYIKKSFIDSYSNGILLTKVSKQVVKNLKLYQILCHRSIFSKVEMQCEIGLLFLI